MNAEAVLPDLSALGSDESEQDTENEDWSGRGRNCMSPEIAPQTSHQVKLEDGKSVSSDSDSDSLDQRKTVAKRRNRRFGHQPSTSAVVQSGVGNLDSDDSRMDADDLDANRLMSMLRTICDTVKENTRCLKELQKAQAEIQHSR